MAISHSTFNNTSVLSHFFINMGLLNGRMLLTALTTAYFKVAEKTPATAEDQVMMQLSKQPQSKMSAEQVERYHDPDTMVNRVRRIHQNDIESSLPNVGVAVAMVLLCLVQDRNDEKIQWMANGLLYSYTISRFLYYYSYLKALQPHRTMAWSLGVLSTLGMIGFSYTLL